MLDNKEIGWLGEVHPKIINNFNLEVPIVALELSLDNIYELINNKIAK